MNKPITVLRHEYIDGIINLSNEIGLPAFVKAEVLKSILEEMQSLAVKEYQNDLAAYNSQNEVVDDG